MRVTESCRAGYMDYVVISHLRDVVFRPRFVKREPVRAIDGRYEMRYSYRDEELPGEIQRTLTETAAAYAVE